MEDPHEILEFYETPRFAVVGILPISIENIVPVLQDDIDKVRLEEVGELEMSIEETTITEHDPYSPVIPVRQPKKQKISKYVKTPLRYLANGKNVFNIRGPLDSVSSSPNKPWRPFLLKSPKTSPVPQNNKFLQSASIHDKDLISNDENCGGGDMTESRGNKLDDLENKKTSLSDIVSNKKVENEEKLGDSRIMNELETIFNTSRDKPYIENNESNESIGQDENEEINEQVSNRIQETHKTTEVLANCVDDRSCDSRKDSIINNGLKNHKMEDPFISEIEREINKFCNVLKGSEISSPIKILSQSAGQVSMDKVTPNKNLSFNKPKETGDRALQGDNVLVTSNRGIESKSIDSKSFVSGHEYSSDDEIFPTKKKIRIETNQIYSTSQNKVLVNKENNP